MTIDSGGKHEPLLYISFNCYGSNFGEKIIG